MKITPVEILDTLGIEPGDVLFVSAGMNHLGYRAPETLALLEALLARIGPAGTLLMPSFPYPNDIGRPPDDFVFDVRRSPSQMGLLTEMFRRLPDTLRSKHHWVPSCARGPLAAELVAGQSTLRNPFGPGSLYHRLLAHGTKMIGLGVTTNYIVVSHTVDAELENLYPFKVFTDATLRGSIIDTTGERTSAETVLVTQSFRRHMKPSFLIAASERLRSELRHVSRDGAIIFSLPALSYYEEAVRLGRDALATGRIPPWLTALPR